MFTIFLQIIPLFAIIGLGWLITHFKIANSHWNKPISDFALYIGFPALIFSGIAKAPIDLNLLTNSFNVNSIIMIGIVLSILISFKFIKTSNRNKATILICFMFGNVAFLGIPLISNLNPLLQQEATLNTAIHLFWIFSIGLFLVEYLNNSKPDIRKISFNLLKNPLLIAVLIGLLVNLLHINIHNSLLKPIEMIGTAVSPMVMIMIGIFIKSNPLTNLISNFAPAIYSIIKLIAIPIVCILFIKLFSSPEIYFTTIIDFSMPIAITPFALADYYNLNKHFISSSIVLSTIISIITIPIIIHLINTL